MKLIFRKTKSERLENERKFRIGRPVVKVRYRDRETGTEFEQAYKNVEYVSKEEIKNDERKKKNLLGNGLDVVGVEKGETVFSD